MSSLNNKSVVDFIYNGEVMFSKKEYEQLRQESKDLLMTPLKIMALLIAISGLFAMIFEVRYFSQYSVNVYLTRLIATLIAFVVLVMMYTNWGKERPIILVHILLTVIIISSGYMIYLMPTTLVVNSQIVGLMIFTSALFLSWDVKNQIIVAIYYNIVFAAAILLNDKSIYFLPNMYESVIFVLFLSVISVVGSAVNFKLRMQLAERSYKVQLSEQKFHSIFENSAEGIFQSSLDGRFLTVNPALVRMLGYASQEELLTINITNDLYKYPEQRDMLIKELKEKKQVTDYRIALKKKDGSELVVKLNDRLMNESDEGQIYFEGNMSDITEQVMAEQKRREAEEELKREKLKSDRLAKEATNSATVKSQFLANMSHEIRTPMNGVIGYLTLIEKEAYDDIREMKEFAMSAKDSAENLLDIINDILDLSKIEAGRMELEKTDFDLGDVISESVSLLGAKIKEKGLEIVTDISDGTMVNLIGDPTRLRQIFLNLLSNAVKFTQKGKISIAVRTEKINDSEAMLHASVTDEGIGIPSDKIGELFKPFTQADGSHTRRFGGTGLGLVICRQFVEMMEGTIGVESIEGNGSKFSFSAKMNIPKNVRYFSGAKELSAEKSELSDKKVQTHESAAAKAVRSKYNILLAEDNLINQKVAMRLLSDAGFNAQAVNNGIEVVNAVKNGRFDLVLMDVQMPEMDGFSATRVIREMKDKKADIPIIAITAHALIGDREKCIEAGMNDYLSKPLEIQQFMSVLNKWLNLKSDNVSEDKSDDTEDVVFDFKALSQMSLGDKAFEKELLASYQQDVNQRFNKLKDLVDSRNVEKLINEAHTIKGASYSVGAKKVGDEALGIELSGKYNDMQSVVKRMNSLKDAILKTNEIIENYI